MSTELSDIDLKSIKSNQEVMDTTASTDPDHLSDTSNTSRKRRRDKLSDTDDQETSLQNMSLQEKMPNNITRLRLEAIFHSKFDNEKRTDQVIRNEMLHNVKEAKGYLEVTLKHSGSLVLWSGGQRFYSKNSTQNQFTYTAEILLRQHFYRAWYSDNNSKKDESSSMDISASTSIPSQFQECSDYAEKHRLTFAFEVVTAVLGDHGDIPNRDFIILTAIADRSKERFYSTTEVLELAQRFRLPHNDSWICTSHEAVQKLFDFYDTERETALAKETCYALDGFSDAHVASMYPHDVFQGDILEGIIIRYVPYRDQMQMQQQQVAHVMGQLSEKANTILNKVPPSMEPCFELVKEDANIPGVFKTDIRTLFEESGGATKRDDQKFADLLENVLKESTGLRRRVEKITSKCDLPSLTSALTNSSDFETRRAAEMLRTLGNLKSAVHYTIVKEEQPSETGEARYLCIIHVLYDATFQKFRQHMSPTGMPLFRGFCLELVSNVGSNMDSSSENNGMNQVIDSGFQEPVAVDTGALMLKMKFLPYMVRTFICRNKLKIAMQKDPEEFINVAAKQLQSWGISDVSRQKWIPFFERWASYANLQDGKNADSSNNLPPLSEFSYLRHLQYLEQSDPKSFEPPTSKFDGFVIIVAANVEKAKAAANFVSEKIGGIKVVHGKTMTTAFTPRNICYLALGDSSKPVRGLLKKVKKYSVVVLVGCAEEDLRQEYADKPNDVKKQMGLSKYWKSAPCRSLVELPMTVFETSEDSSDNNDIDQLLKTIKESEKEFPSPKTQDNNTQPGAIIFFPVIPGFGKSAILDAGFVQAIERRLEECGALASRKLEIRVGDKMGKKYWKILEKEASEKPSTILLADKNVPPISWPSLGKIYEVSQMSPLPVIPASGALETTTIKGARDPKDGSLFSDNCFHYPFSLAFLAVCMARVLKREPSTHAGKLDSGADQVCMIVVAFYSFYRHISADEFEHAMNRKLSKDASIEVLSPIRLPFFAADLELPSDLTEVLVEALQLQQGFDINKIFRPKGDEPTVQDMEKRLRECISKHTDLLLSSTVSLEKSRTSFLTDLEDRLLTLKDGPKNSKKVEDGNDIQETRFIKLASLDVPANDVHSLLREHADSFAKEFLQSSLSAKSLKKFLEGATSTLVKMTHVTMAFHDRTPQKDMLDLYGDAIGSQVDVIVKSILWSDRVAALGVDIAEISSTGKKIPRPQNEFPHITIWFQDNARASEANELPAMVEAGLARMEILEKPIKLTGTLSFWGNGNKPLVVTSYRK